MSQTSQVTFKDILNQVNDQTSAATDTFKNIMGLLFKDQETGTSTKTNVLSLFETILSTMMNKQPDEEKSDQESETDELDVEMDESDELETESDEVETETDSEEVDADSDESYDSDSTDLDAEDEFVYLLHRGDHKYRYTTTREKAMKSITTELRHFMKKNILSFYRVEKDETKTVVFERYPNTLDPYDEKIVFQIYIIKVKKY